MEQEWPYTASDKLRPRPFVNSCKCTKLEKIILVNLLTENPIVCEKCRGEISPEVLSLTDSEIDSIDVWNGVWQSLYTLWLHSGDYENYSKTCLLAPYGQVNLLGLEIIAQLDKKIPAKYWFFHDESDPSPKYCPYCNKTLDEQVNWGHGQCLDCKIHI